MSAPALAKVNLGAGKQSSQSSQTQGAKKVVGLDADKFSLLRTVGNNAAYHLIDPADRFSIKPYNFNMGNTANSDQFTPTSPANKKPVDNLGDLDENLINTIAFAVAPNNFFEQRLIAATMRGFISEMDNQLIDQNKAQRFQERMFELRQPGTLAAYLGGYVAGFTAGMASPVTGMFGIPAFVDVVDDFIKLTVKNLSNTSSKLIDEGVRIALHFKQFEEKMNSALLSTIFEIMNEQVKNPNSNLLSNLIEKSSDSAMQMAGAMGHSVAAKTIKLFESPWEEDKENDPGWESILPKDMEAAIKNPQGALLATLSRGYEYGSERFKKSIITTPWSKVGYEIGSAVGMVLSNVLLFVATEGIGNAISMIGKLASSLRGFRTIGEALKIVGSTVSILEEAIAIITKTILKPLEKVLKPLLDLLKDFGAWLDKLFPIAEKEGAELTAKVGGKLAPKIEPPLTEVKTPIQEPPLKPKADIPEPKVEQVDAKPKPKAEAETVLEPATEPLPATPKAEAKIVLEPVTEAPPAPITKKAETKPKKVKTKPKKADAKPKKATGGGVLSSKRRSLAKNKLDRSSKELAESKVESSFFESDKEKQIAYLKNELEKIKADEPSIPPEISKEISKIDGISKDDEEILTKLQELRGRPSLSNEAKEYIDWKESFIDTRKEMSFTEEGKGELLSNKTSNDIASVERAEIEFSKASKTIANILRKPGPNLINKRMLEIDEILGKELSRDLAISRKNSSKGKLFQVDHLYTVDEIAKSGQMDKIVELYEKLPPKHREDLVKQIQLLGDKKENLVSLWWDTNNKKSNGRLRDLSQDYLSELKYPKDKWAELLEREADMELEMPKAIENIIETFSNLVKK